MSRRRLSPFVAYPSGRPVPPARDYAIVLKFADPVASRLCRIRKPSGKHYQSAPVSEIKRKAWACISLYLGMHFLWSGLGPPGARLPCQDRVALTIGVRH